MLGIFKRTSDQVQEAETNVDLEQEEYIQYAKDVESTLSLMEAGLHTFDDPKEIAMCTLKTACDFYQADWAGILVADINISLWSPLWWYNTNPIDRTSQLVKEFESSEYFGTWLASLQTDAAITITNTEELKYTNPGAYEVYHRLRVNSALAVPFKPRPKGFLVVRNPKRYIQRSSMLQMLGYVALTSVNEKKLLESAKMVSSPSDIKNDSDVLINVFGSLEIFTSKGVLHESDIKSPKMCRMLIYMLLNNRSAHPPREIAEALWPEEITDHDNVGGNLRGLVFRFRQIFSMISEYQLIESTTTGYRLNPNIRIKTDMQSFDRAWEAVQTTSTLTQKIEYIMRAISIFKGEIYPSASGEHWLIGTSTHYSLRYIGLINELLFLLAKLGEWDDVNRYASKSLLIMPGNVKAHFWLIYAMYRSGAIEMAKGEVAHAESILTYEEYANLVARLKKARSEPVELA